MFLFFAILRVVFFIVCAASIVLLLLAGFTVSMSEDSVQKDADIEILSTSFAISLLICLIGTLVVFGVGDYIVDKEHPIAEYKLADEVSCSLDDSEYSKYFFKVALSDGSTLESSLEKSRVDIFTADSEHPSMSLYEYKAISFEKRYRLYLTEAEKSLLQEKTAINQWERT